MCIIIHKPKGVDFKEEDIKVCYQNNRDGFGYMYFDPEQDKIITSKSIALAIEEIVAVFKKLKDYETCFHFRFKTHGAIEDAQCHPFRVLDKKKHGFDLFFMHNGVISDVETTLKMNDTQSFNKNILKPILTKKPELALEPAFQKLIFKFIGNGSKLCFMHSDGQVFKVNEEAGQQYEGCWVSNKYSFQHNYLGSTYYGNNTSNFSKTDTKTTTTGNTAILPTKAEPFKMCQSVDVSVGDKVSVFSKNDKSFITEGIVSAVNTYTCSVDFTTLKLKEETIAFWMKSGESTCYQKYYFIPPLKITEELFNWETKTVKAVREDNKPVVDDQPQEEHQRTKVTYKQHTFDLDNRWGGYGADIYASTYGSGVGSELFTMLDIYSMSPVERMMFFTDHPEEAFNMLQDAVERIVMDEEMLDDEISEDCSTCYNQSGKLKAGLA